MLGVAYKRGTGDVRESPALDIIHLLREKGARVAYHDPHVPSRAHDGVAMRSVEDLESARAEADCVVVTDHAAYDWDAVRERARLVVDTRNATGRGGGRA